MNDHCVIDLAAQPPLFRCELCGAEQALQLPISLHEAAWLGEQSGLGSWLPQRAVSEARHSSPSLADDEQLPMLQ